MTVIDQDDEVGLRLSSRTIGSGERSVTLYEVHQWLAGNWLPIGNDNSSGLEEARERYLKELKQLRGKRS